MKLNEVEALKGKGGNYYGMDEILGEEIEITESIDPTTHDFREYKTKNENLYFCIEIKHTEQKDLHVTPAALRAVGEALPKNENWQGYKIRINRTGSGFKTAYKISVTGKGIGSYGTKAPAPVAPDPTALILDALRPPVGIHDSRIPDILKAACPDPNQGAFIWNVLKSSGKVTQKQDGCWVRT